MMRHFFLLLAACSVLFSQSASADHRFSSGFTTFGANQFEDKYYREGFYRPNYSGYSDGGRRNRRNRWYGWGYGRGFGGLSYNGLYPRYRSFGGFGVSDGEAMIGEIILESLLNYANPNRYPAQVINRNQPARTRSIISTGQPARSRSVISSSRPRSTLINQNGRRLVRDIEGKCFERTQNSSGEELRVELDPAECAFRTR